MKIRLPKPIGPFEKTLFAGWTVFIVAAVGSLFLSRYKWIHTFGVEILFFLFVTIALSSMLYACFVLMARVRSR